MLPELRSTLLLLFENFCATSDLQILKRISALEEELEEVKAENEQLKTELKKAKPEIPESPLAGVPSTITDIRTDHLVEYIESDPDIPEADSGFVNMTLKYMNSLVFKKFVTKVLPEQLRPKTLKNLRKLKKDLFENAATRYKSKAFINKSDHGNKEIRLVIGKECGVTT